MGATALTATSAIATLFTSVAVFGFVRFFGRVVEAVFDVAAFNRGDFVLFGVDG